MYSFRNDYNQAAHPQVMAAITALSGQSFLGYGDDPYTASVKDKIREQFSCPDADVHFLSGGTQVNLTVIAHFLRPHQGVISADTGHIAVHETGAIEATGHKVLTLPNVGGKITADQVEALCASHDSDEAFEHTVRPGMVYLSQATEVGTVYFKKELQALRAVCDWYDMPLYVDGARLGYGLASPACDMSLHDMAQLCDAFTIGGTKQGALFGEALVITKPELAKQFRYAIKQRGAMLAKGFLMAAQFDALLKDGLYFDLSSIANDKAQVIAKAFLDRGAQLAYPSPTNQQFVVLTYPQQDYLRRRFDFSMIAPGKDSAVVRFCTSWATTDEAVETLVAAIAAMPQENG